MAKRKERSFGRIIRERRRQLDLTQQEVAHRVKTSTPYIGHLESNKRHPSTKVLSRLAEVLVLDQRELFLLANPKAVKLLMPKAAGKKHSAWEEFRNDEGLRQLHHLRADEMDLLSRIASMGEISSPRDFIYILNTIRHALGR